MVSFQLTDEQHEIRASVREFVAVEMKPAALKPARLDSSECQLPEELFKQTSRLGLRTLALPESMGGAGAYSLTACLVAEELAPGLSVQAPVHSPHGEPLYAWHHGAVGEFVFDRCRVPAVNQLGIQGSGRDHCAIVNQE